MDRRPEVFFAAGVGGAPPSGSDAGTAPSAAARGLGLSGLLPFLALALVLWVAPAPSAAARLAAFALPAYGAVIASFLGGIHWGLAMRAGSAPSAASLLWGVVPSLLAWAALLLPAAPGLLLLAALLWACYAMDRRAYPRWGAAAWLPLRLRLTWVASGSCVAGAAALWSRVGT